MMLASVCACSAFNLYPSLHLSLGKEWFFLNNVCFWELVSHVPVSLYLLALYFSVIWPLLWTLIMITGFALINNTLSLCISFQLLYYKHQHVSQFIKTVQQKMCTGLGKPVRGHCDGKTSGIFWLNIFWHFYFKKLSLYFTKPMWKWYLFSTLALTICLQRSCWIRRQFNKHNN